MTSLPNSRGMKEGMASAVEAEEALASVVAEVEVEEEEEEVEEADDDEACRRRRSAIGRRCWCCGRAAERSLERGIAHAAATGILAAQRMAEGKGGKGGRGESKNYASRRSNPQKREFFALVCLF